MDFINLIYDLIDFNLKYDLSSNKICQAYTEEGSAIRCDQIATKGLNILEYLILYFELDFNFECCVFCKHHYNYVLSKIKNFLFYKGIEPGVKFIYSKLTGLPSDDLWAITPEYQKQTYKKFDYGKKKRKIKSKSRKKRKKSKSKKRKF